MGPYIHPSILCADHENLGDAARALAAAGADYFHMDVMDGSFVPNFGLGVDVFGVMLKHGGVPLDAHLMIQKPERHIEYFAKLGSELITIHPEASTDPARVLAQIRSLGLRAGIALCPETEIESVTGLLDKIDHCLVMTVRPGFYGQHFLDSTLPKIIALGKLRAEYGFSLGVDGNINRERIRQLHPLGVTNFVVGTALFDGGDLGVGIARMRGVGE